MKKQLVKVVIMVSMIPLLIWLNCNSKANEIQSQEKVIVKTAPVRLQDISFPIHTSGRLASKTEMKLSFKVGGIIQKIFVDEGQTLKKGQILATLDLSEINAKVIQARSGFEKTKRDFERVKRLYADSVATLEQMQDATTALEIARSNLKVAEFNLQHSAIYSPVDGKVLKRFVEVNELIGVGMPAFIFGSSGKDWIVRVGVADCDIIRIQLADSAVVSVDAYPDVKFPARISEIAEAADPMSGTFEVELSVDTKNYKIISGFIAKVEIFPAKKQRLFIVPIESLIEGDGHNGFVYTLATNREKAKKIPVKVGFILEKEVAIVAGLENVNQVITDGASYLTDGAEVKLVEVK